MPTNSLVLALDEPAFRAVLSELIDAGLAKLDAARTAIPERLAFTEAEAARLIGLSPHQLRDERRRGRIVGSKIVGNQTRYLRSDLVAYLMRQRTDAPR